MQRSPYHFAEWSSTHITLTKPLHSLHVRPPVIFVQQMLFVQERTMRHICRADSMRLTVGSGGSS